MNSARRTILVWVLILVAAVGLYQFVEHGASPSVGVMNLTDFIESVQSGNVRRVAINGAQVTGVTVNNERFMTTIPSDIASIADRLVSAGVEVTIVPPGNTWIAVGPWVIPMLFLGLTVVFMVQVQGYLRAPDPAHALPSGAPPSISLDPARASTRLVREGDYLAEVPVEWEADEGGAPYLSPESSKRINEVREALKRGDSRAARRLARVYHLTDAS